MPRVYKLHALTVSVVIYPVREIENWHVKYQSPVAPVGCRETDSEVRQTVEYLQMRGCMMATITNMRLKQDVITELNWEARVGIFSSSENPEIRVAVTDGVVTLHGEVDSNSRKWDAYRAAKRVVGVKEVVDNIKVRLPGFSKSADEQIYRVPTQAMDLNVCVSHDRIRVRVQDGSITLTGEVDWACQRETEGVILHPGQSGVG